MKTTQKYYSLNRVHKKKVWQERDITVHTYP